MKNQYLKIKLGILGVAALLFLNSTAQTASKVLAEEIISGTVNGKVVPIKLTIERDNATNTVSNSMMVVGNGSANNSVQSQPASISNKGNKVSLLANICDSITNILNPPNITVITWSNGTASGYIAGTGPLADNRYAEEYDVTSSSATHIQWFTVKFSKAVASTDTGKFYMVLWQDNGAPAGAPGTELSRFSLNYKTVQDAIALYGTNNLFRFSFASPIAIPGNKKFLIGTSAGRISSDTLALACQGDTVGNKAWCNVPSGAWNKVSTIFTWSAGGQFPVGKPAAMRTFITVGITDVPVTVSALPNGDTICAGTSINYTATGTNAVSYKWTFQGGSIPSSLVQNPPAVTYANPGQFFYNIQGFNSCGFSHSLFRVIRVDSLPPVVMTSAAKICSGTSSFLTASGANSYVWAGGAIGGLTTPTVSVSPTSTLTYSVTGTRTSTGCAKTVTKVIGPFPSPVADFSWTVTDTMCPDVNYLFNGTISTDETSYTWTFPGGNPATSTASNPSVGFTTSGLLQISLRVDNGCGQLDSTTKSTIVQGCYAVGINEQKEKAVQSYFDATSSTLKLTLNREFKGSLNLTVHNNLGQLVIMKNINTNSSDVHTIQLPTLEKGVYYVRISDSSNLYTDSFVY